MFGSGWTVDACRHVGLVGQIGSVAREVWGKAGGRVPDCRCVKRAARNMGWGCAKRARLLAAFRGWDGMDGQQLPGWMPVIFLLFLNFLGTLRFDMDWKLYLVAQLCVYLLVNCFDFRPKSGPSVLDHKGAKATGKL